MRQLIEHKSGWQGVSQQARAPQAGGQGIACLGKIPGRGDFIRQGGNLALVERLDGWLGQFMESLSASHAWQQHYDGMAPLHLVFAGAGRRHAIAAHLAASHDRSGRRYPLLLLHAMEVGEPAAFVHQCPLVLEPLWRRMAALSRVAIAAADPAASLQAIAAARVELEACSAGAQAAFLATGTIASLNALLGQGDARRVILALGMLLQPVLQSGAQELGKSLALPLPKDEAARCHVAAFWMGLIAPFLRRTDVELALFLTEIEGAPTLVAGFRGACAQTLQAIMDPAARAGHQVGFGDTAWVDRQFGVDVDVRALASYLEQPQLPLRLARELFLRAFAGAAH